MSVESARSNSSASLSGRWQQEATTKSTKELWRVYDAISRQEVYWSIRDQPKLISIDSLCRRVAELHKNQFTFRLGDQSQIQELLDPIDPASLSHVVDIAVYPSNGESCYRTHLTFAGVKPRLDHLDRSAGVVWVHVRDLRALPTVLDSLGVNPFAASLFNDTRCHSSISAFATGIFASMCYLKMNCDAAELYKIYYYSKDQLMITFERELCGDDSSEQSIATRDRVSAYISDQHGFGDAAIDALLKVMREIQRPALEAGVCTDVMSRVKCTASVGGSAIDSVYLLYQIGIRSLFFSEEFIESLTRTISYLKTRVFRTRIRTREYMNIFRDLNVLRVSLRLSLRLVSESDNSMEAILNKSSAEFELYRQDCLNSLDQRLLLAELNDSFHHRGVLIEEMFQDVTFVDDCLTHSSELNAQRDSRNLSLVGTVFMPLSFVAGIFGMNFYPGGGSSIELLNNSNGPQWFAGICLC